MVEYSFQHLVDGTTFWWIFSPIIIEKDVSEWNINRAVLVMERALPFTKHKNELFVGLFIKCDDHGFWIKKWNDNGFFTRRFRLFRHIEIMGYIGNINLNHLLSFTFMISSSIPFQQSSVAMRKRLQTEVLMGNSSNIIYKWLVFHCHFWLPERVCVCVYS